MDTETLTNVVHDDAIRDAHRLHGKPTEAETVLFMADVYASQFGPVPTATYIRAFCSTRRALDLEHLDLLYDRYPRLRE